MKKKLTIIAAVLIVAATCFALTACSGDDTLSVKSYEIAESKVNIGDTHGTPTITANMSDDTTKTVANNLVYDETDIAKLKLEDNKYTTAGEYIVKVYILEQQDKFFLGEWKIIVKVTK